MAKHWTAGTRMAGVLSWEEHKPITVPCLTPRCDCQRAYFTDPPRRVPVRFVHGGAIREPEWRDMLLACAVVLVTGALGLLIAGVRP